MALEGDEGFTFSSDVYSVIKFKLLSNAFGFILNGACGVWGHFLVGLSDVLVQKISIRGCVHFVEICGLVGGY